MNSDLEKYKEEKAEMLSEFCIGASRLGDKFWAAKSKYEVDRIALDLIMKFV